MKSLEELAAVREKYKAEYSLTQTAQDKTRVLVGMATCGIAAGASPVMAALQEKAKGMDEVLISMVGCIGVCQYEPVVEVVEPGKEKVMYVKMTAEKMAKVVDEHLKNGRVVEEYTIGAAQ